MTKPRWSRLTAAVLLAWAALSAPVLAQVTLSFHGHEGARIRGGFLYFPHAYVRFSGTLETTGEPVERAVGFTARDPGPQLLFMSGRGLLAEPDAVYLREGIEYLSLTISDETYHALQAEIETWREARYNLRRRNCIHFAAVVAEGAGLAIPSTDTLSPNGFMQNLVAMNPHAAPQPTPVVVEAAAPEAAEPPSR